MNKRYNFLLIDDKKEAIKGLELMANMNNITIFHFETHKAGMEELESSINEYDAVILDALGYNESIDESEEITGLHQSLRKLASLQREKVIPHCIYSAYTDKDIFQAQKLTLPPEIRIFSKTGGASAKEMLKFLMSEADNQIDTQIKNDHQKLFEVLKSYSSDSKKVFFDVLKGFKTDNSLNDALYFTPLRKILEELFRKANEVGLLHDTCVSKNGNQVNLTESSKFLSGTKSDLLQIKCSKSHFPKIISDHVRNILFTTGAASHTVDVDITKNIDVQTFREDVQSPYLLYSLAMQLADILIWFHNYSASNSNYSTNVALWESLTNEATSINEDDWIEGEVIKVENGFGTFKPNVGIKTLTVMPNVMTDNKILLGNKLKVTTKPSPDGQKTFIKDLEVIKH
jgi:hypothetical protein